MFSESRLDRAEATIRVRLPCHKAALSDSMRVSSRVRLFCHKVCLIGATNRMRIRLSSHEGYLIGINSGISSRVEYHYLVGSCLSQSQG